ncbi:DHH family phosphoesterase [Enterococcus casseliflavus]|uniref:DHH family phosphoesterase n=1 Tax=Enterococcus casseliflavus TaxID=37734 RepID=UPI00201D1E2E|nr:bifunctional oligoribonuclease/PAP phosphatase NrnA [Enterococcus casseliflavus]MDT2988778.1 bifunctional oligoribonuclease/PAP phosphatase NrnA [Enterococcus casseliflavus]MDV7688161.1 bifunctional oligoribonuclease/PAP phosphatase NrnA [Enterococcus casseliflavus]MDV7711359.1 bifunctional oligoribonuclease/PAP phosphatase NrnA [Enterococcus casseliflavus]MDV7736188.1 bifunctional oligoribonuclease/PAP phosphatase NrnA [Enterococcus casseliflavus]UQZ98389.1 bifunctional oligoribonuclease/P
MKVQEEILATIKAFDRIIIHRHQRPDPDALGSQVGLAEILRASFPEKEIYQVGGPVEGLDYLALMQTIPDDLYKGALVIVTDTANAPRVSDQRYDQGAKLIKIDHHPNDEPYGELVWVNTKASSCSEMIVSFWQMFQNELTMTQEAARLLYAGIVGDTGRFLYPATTATTLRLAAELLDYGFDAPKINRQLDQVSRSVARLSGYVYENIEIDEIGAGKVILSQELQQRFGVVDSETSAVVSLPGKIDEVMAWAIFVEQPEGYYRVRMRSKGPVINEIAKRHHGGGHPLASGANAKDLEEVALIYQEIQAAIKEFQGE